MNEDIRIMMEIYGTYQYDWLGDEFKSPKELTRHHIVKREYGGENGISNYALLTHSSHSFMHYLEDNFYKEYNYLNTMFLELNRSVNPPSSEYYEEVHRVVKRIKKIMKNNKTLRRK